MAKRVSKAPAMQWPPQQPLVINPFGPTEQRKITKSTVKPSEFVLDDGTTLLVTPMMADVRRALDQFNQEGQPLYFVTLGQLIKTSAPPRLMKPKKSAKKKTKKAARKSSR